MSEKTSTTKNADGLARYRNFATIVYPESAPENWLEILSEHKIPAFVSPLHDRDFRANGEYKKPHYHVMVMFEGKKSNKQIKEIFDTIGGTGLEVVKSLRAYARYLCHLDDADKAQYCADDVKEFGGAFYAETISSIADKYAILDEIEDFCERYNVVSFYVLSKYARINKPMWSRVLRESGAYYIEKVLKSKKWSQENNEIQIIDPETGELVM